METTDNKLNRIITEIRHQQPEFQDAGKLTESIMQEVRNLPRTKVPKILVWVRVVSGAAAIFLLVLFFAQSDGREVVASNYRSALLNFKKSEIDSTCFMLNKSDQNNLLEIYTCYLRKNAIENNQHKIFKQISEN